MRVNPFYATTVLIAWSLFGLIAPASASCTWFNLQNGNTADATQVMADFNCLQGNVEVDNGYLNVTNGIIYSGGSAAGFAFYDRANANNVWVWYSTGNTAFLWKNFNTAGNVVSVDQNGNVGIGTSTPDTAMRLTLDKTTGDGDYGGISFRAGGTYEGRIEQEITGNMYYDAVTDMYLRPGNSATAMVLKANGFIGIGITTPSYLLRVNGNAFANSWQTPSDARLKKNIAPILGAMDTIQRLQGVHFEWRDVKERSVGKSLDLPTDKPQVGFIAQEVRTVLPEAVSADKDGIMSVQESKVVPILVEAVKGLNKELKQERSEYENLKVKNDRQSAVVAQLEREVAELSRRGNLASTGTETIFQRVALAFGWY